MKQNLLFTFTFISLIIRGTNAQTCLSDGITFTTQPQIDAFATDYPGCTTILGYVNIQESVNGTITNLTGLGQLSSIGGHLGIYGNGALSSLTGLDNITSIGGNLDIGGNNTLSNLTGLNNLTSIGGDLSIGSSVFDGNPALNSLTGLDQLSSIGGVLGISDNDALTSLAALHNIISISGLGIIDNAVLSSLTGLENISSIEGNLAIGGTSALTSLTGLDQLSSIGANLIIGGTSAMTSLTGLNSLSSIGGNLDIGGNNALSNLTGLDQLTSIGGYLNIFDNDALTTTTGLNSLTTIGGDLDIRDNNVLTSLMGLDKINATTITTLFIGNSSVLSICDVQSICAYLTIPSNPAFIWANATGCATRAEIEAACTVPVNEATDEWTTIKPNPTTGILEITGVEMERGAYAVSNAIGSIVKQGIIQSRRIDISELASGMYLISLHSDHSTAARRVLKE